MNDSLDASAQGVPSAPRWLLLIVSLPPTPDYLRVKIRRRLKRLGAAAVKQTVYLLRNTDEALEDFHWLREEIQAAGGSAIIAEASFVEGLAEEEVEAMLQSEHSGAVEDEEADGGELDHVEPGRTWVTRTNVHVDRIASAWLIRRFIDPAGRFKFVPARGYRPRASELRFDMFEAEYTHVGENCTFQTLAKRFGVTDRAARLLGEIVHDIDCKDATFGHSETSGIETLIQGIANAHDDDAVRIARGSAALDDLYASFAKRRR